MVASRASPDTPIQSLPQHRVLCLPHPDPYGTIRLDCSRNRTESVKPRSFLTDNGAQPSQIAQSAPGGSPLCNAAAMADLTQSNLDDVLAVCRSGAEEAAAAIGRALDHEVGLVVGEAVALDAPPVAAALAGPGLAVVFMMGETGALVALPDSSGLVPSWCADPDPTGRSKLTTLAQEPPSCPWKSAGLTARAAPPTSSGPSASPDRSSLRRRRRNRPPPRRHPRRRRQLQLRPNALSPPHPQSDLSRLTISPYTPAACFASR